MSEFDKVIGYEDIKMELKRYCDIVKNPEKYKKLGVQTPRGILMYGTPGLGKSLMAKCFIAESGRKVFTLRKNQSDGDFVNTIRKTFERAKQEAPCIVFLDDMDKFANEDREHPDAEEYVAVQTGIDECKGVEVFLLATVNDRRSLPDSLHRAGRFDKLIGFKKPNKEDAKKIIEHYLAEKQTVGDVNAEEVARLIEGKSCAELESVINEAGIYAGYDGRKQIERKDIIKACMRLLFDAPECMNPNESVYTRHVAVHEAGHTVLAEVLEPGSVNLVSICKFGGSAEGITKLRKSEDEYYSKELMEHRVISALGGKAATEMVYGIADTGCNSDMQEAFDTVNEFVDNFCSLGFQAFEGNNSSGYLLEMKDRLVAVEIERYYRMAKKIIAENRAFLDAVTEALMEKQTLTCEDVSEIRRKYCNVA
jgi:cell division protease FtsH